MQYTASNEIASQIHQWLSEDGEVRRQYLSANFEQEVSCTVLIKTPLVCAGLEWFFAVFEQLLGSAKGGDALSKQKNDIFEVCEGAQLMPDTKFSFSLPLGVALRGERLALNLLHRASSVATATREMRRAIPLKSITLLDTRKTTPGLRELEKYAVFVGGGRNHRFDQNDVVMIKDNHKSCLGGLAKALDFYRQTKGFYTPIIVEIHSLEELIVAKELGVTNVMLDNFSPAKIAEAVSMKPSSMVYEVSGGMRPSSVTPYCIEGVDAISSSYMTQSPPAVDFSLKYCPEPKKSVDE